jgi:L-asparaginase II
MSYMPAVEVLRGGVVESIHSAALAVVDPKGNLIAAWGSPEFKTYMRSSAKPIQVLPFLEAGGVARFGLNPKEIAVMCASHSGTDEHVRTVTSILDKAGLSEAHLLCGTHPPTHRETADRLKREGLEPTSLRHNCSGKHAGMLAFSKLLGTSIEDYVNLEHPIQQRILRTLSEMCELDIREISIGVDGCSVPTFAVPLRSAALAFARLADPSELSHQRTEACHKVWEAMTAYPKMVAGPERLDTALMNVAGGNLISKGGAEGYQGIAIAPGARYKGSTAAGVAIKVVDGDRGGRARSVIALKVLEELGVLSSEKLAALDGFGPRKQTNWREIEVGEIRACFQLQHQST